LLRVWMILAGLSPLCMLSALAAATPPAGSRPVVQATPGGRAVMVTGGPVVEVDDYTPTPEPAVWCVVDTGGPVLMVRSTPEQDPKKFNNRLGTVADGESLRILGMARTKGKVRTWYHVRVDNAGDEYEGWVAAMYCRREVAE
jgi:hypothetical protein